MRIGKLACFLLLPPLLTHPAIGQTPASTPSVAAQTQKAVADIDAFTPGGAVPARLQYAGCTFERVR